MLDVRCLAKRQNPLRLACLGLDDVNSHSNSSVHSVVHIQTFMNDKKLTGQEIID